MFPNLPTDYQKLIFHTFLLRALPFGRLREYSFPLSTTEPIWVGREHDYPLRLDHLYYGTSNHHFAIYSRAASDASDIRVWGIHDSSGEGTYINGKILHHKSQTLQVGDRIRVGKDGPEFIFEMQTESYQ